MLSLVWNAQASGQNPAAEFDAREFAKWEVTPTGDYEDDCAIGRARADDLISHIRAGGFPGTLTHALNAMMQSGRKVSGIEVGFGWRIAEALR